ncbi:MAG TPA: hypothetical protein VJA94_22985, partial [Candidatus Angelobacter sp.]
QLPFLLLRFLQKRPKMGLDFSQHFLFTLLGTAHYPRIHLANSNGLFRCTDARPLAKFLPCPKLTDVDHQWFGFERHMFYLSFSGSVIMFTRNGAILRLIPAANNAFCKLHVEGSQKRAPSA